MPQILALQFRHISYQTLAARLALTSNRLPFFIRRRKQKLFAGCGWANLTIPGLIVMVTASLDHNQNRLWSEILQQWNRKDSAALPAKVGTTCLSDLKEGALTKPASGTL